MSPGQTAASPSVNGHPSPRNVVKMMGPRPALQRSGRSRLALHRSASRSGFVDAFICYGTLLYLFTGTTEGALRYILTLAHLETAIYLRDLFAVIVVVWRVRVEIHSPATGRPLLKLLQILFVWTIIGSVYCSSVWQALLGLKMFLPLMLGIGACSSVYGRTSKIFPLILILWALATVGVCASAVVRMPWVGLSYMVGDVQVVGSREWTIEGVSRLAGLSRSSIAAGCQILFFAVFLMCFSRSRILSLVVWASSAPAVLLTTSRSALLGYAAASAFWFLFWLFPSLHRVWRCAVPLMFGLVILVPLIPADGFRFIESVTHGKAGQVASFFDRVENTWPEAFDLLATDGSFILGRGLGGIGVAQKTFEPEIENPADNLFVYLFVIFGPLSLLMLASLAFRVQRVNNIRGPAALHMICTALAVAGVGLMLNGVEDSCASIFAGMLVCQLFARGSGWRRLGNWGWSGGSGRR